MSGFSSIGATFTPKCKSHYFLIVGESEIVENGVTMVVTNYQCNVCYEETTKKRKGKLKKVSFLVMLKSIFNI